MKNRIQRCAAGVALQLLIALLTFALVDAVFDGVRWFHVALFAGVALAGWFLDLRAMRTTNRRQGIAQ